MSSPSATLASTPSACARGGLVALRVLFERLDSDGVPYCHWKGNEHLGASMMGEGDLDLLVVREAALPFARVLADLGFKRFAAVPRRAYPGVEDYLGLDVGTGTLAHLHVHYELTVGERYLLGYRIPWEAVLLARRERDEVHEVWRADPASELLLLLVRAILMMRWRDRLLMARRPSALPAAMERELRWLLPRTKVDVVAALARELLGEEAATLAPSLLVGDGPTMRQLRAFKVAIAEPLAGWRSYGTLDALGRRWWREMVSRLGAARWPFGASGQPARRVLPRGGAYIAFVGADGSGKSTLVRDTAEWLGWKLDVVRVYGGSGIGSAGLPRGTMERARALVRRIPGARRAGHPVVSDTGGAPRSRDGARRGRDVSLARLAWVVALARERRQRASRARRARNRGMIVLSDRIAQSQFVGINDGPRLGDPAEYSSSLCRAVARYERRTFRAAGRIIPDLVVRLDVSYDVAARRKPDTPPEVLRRKLAVIDRLHWPAGTRVVGVDASRPLPDVLRDVRRAVWEVL